MANISAELAAIMAAVYGNQVRGSIHDAIDKINKASEVVLSVGTEVDSPTSSSTGFYQDSFYLNSDTYDLWKCTGTNAWQNQGNLKGTDGENGEDGRGIVSITKTSTSGLTDTYTISYTDSTTSTFTVVNGANGEKGADGNKWYKGTGVSGQSATPTAFPNSGVTLAVIGDMFLNSSEGAVYNCTLGGNASTALWAYLFTLTGGGGGGGTDNYPDLNNKPTINNVELNGNKTSSDLGLASASHTHTKGQITDLADATTTASGLMSSSDKTKLNGIASNAQVNVIESIKVNGTAQTITSKAVNLSVIPNPSNPAANNVLTYSGGAWVAAAPQHNTVDQTYSATSTNAQSGTAVAGALAGALDEWTEEATATTSGTDTVVTFTGLNDSLAYDIYCDAENTSAEIKSKTGSGTSVTLVYKLTGSNVLVGTTKAKLRVLK